MDDSIQKALKNYTEIVEKLKKSKFFAETKNISFNLGINRTETNEGITGFDEEYFRSILLEFRKIYMQKEPTNFFKICNLTYANTDDEQTKINISKCREIAKQINTNYPIKFKINEVTENSCAIIDTYLYGHYFHEDNDKKTKLNNLYISSLYKFHFISAVIDYIKLYIVLSNNIDLILNNKL